MAVERAAREAAAAEAAEKQLIHEAARCRAVACHQIGAEGPKNTAAWFVECRCGWAHYAMTHAHAIALYANHKPLRESEP